AHKSDAPMNTVRPIRNTRLRPTRSPIRPASSSSPPNVIRYAFTTHARLDWEKPRSRWIEGSATFTIVASRTIMSMPTHSTTSATQRVRSLATRTSASLRVGGLVSSTRELRGAAVARLAGAGVPLRELVDVLCDESRLAALGAKTTGRIDFLGDSHVVHPSSSVAKRCTM